MAKAIRADPSFRICRWTAEEMDTLLHSIEVHVEAAKLTRNRCEKSLNLINREWDMDAEEYIRSRGLVERTLKLIAAVAKRRDVPDLKTGLLLANTQAVRRIMEGKTFYSRRLFLTSQDWQHCKEDPVPSRELFVKKLYDAGVHLNLAGEICSGRPLLLIPVGSDRSGVEHSGVSGKDGQCSNGKAGGNAPSTTTPTSPTTSAATPPKVHHSGNTLRDNQQSAVVHASVSSTSPKPASGDKISSGKADESATRMMPKASFAEEVDDDDIDFELPSRGRVRGASRLSSGENHTQESVMGRNVAGPPGGQGLLEAESSKKNQLDEWLHCCRCGGLNVMWCEDVLKKPCRDLVGCLGVLGGYFYTHIFICKTHLPLLAVCCHLKTDSLEDIHDRLRTMWTNGLAYSDLMAFAKDHKDWFLSSSPVN